MLSLSAVVSVAAGESDVMGGQPDLQNDDAASRASLQGYSRSAFRERLQRFGQQDEEEAAAAAEAAKGEPAMASVKSAAPDERCCKREEIVVSECHSTPFSLRRHGQVLGAPRRSQSTRCRSTASAPAASSAAS